MGFNIKKVIFFCLALCVPIAIILFTRGFNTHVNKVVAARHVASWKKALTPVGFRGIVSGKNDFNLIERGLYTISLEKVNIENEDSIPMGCEFFEYNKGTIKFTAYSETVSRWPDYGLEKGFIVEKKVNNDTLFVYTPDNAPKYVFELFDGIVNKWKPRVWPH